MDEEEFSWRELRLALIKAAAEKVKSGWGWLSELPEDEDELDLN